MSRRARSPYCPAASEYRALRCRARSPRQASLIGTSLWFDAAICLIASSTCPRGSCSCFQLVVAFSGPTGDLHPQLCFHAQHTPSATLRVCKRPKSNKACERKRTNLTNQTHLGTIRKAYLKTCLIGSAYRASSVYSKPLSSREKRALLFLVSPLEIWVRLQTRRRLLSTPLKNLIGGSLCQLLSLRLIRSK